MEQSKIKVLVIDGKGKPCSQGHPKFFSHGILGTNKRFCTFLIDTYTTGYPDMPKMCGEKK